MHFMTFFSTRSPLCAAVAGFLLPGVLLLVLLAAALDANAHRMRPAIVSADFTGAGTVSIRIDANFEQLMAGITPTHTDTDDAPEAHQYKALRALQATSFTHELRAFLPQFIDNISLRFDNQVAALGIHEVMVPSNVPPERARISTVTLQASVPDTANAFDWQYPAAYGASVLRISVRGEEPVASEWLGDGQRSKAFNVGADLRGLSTTELGLRYIWLGFTHIVPFGLDHVLFVLGMFMLSVHLKPLFWQVTAFTVAHSVTLTLAVLDVWSVSPFVVEPLIALSIIYIAVENLFTVQVSPRRFAVVFAFGLLHGLGFAGVLGEIGLPAGELVTAIVAFNVGVEVGQLAVIAGALAAGFYWLRDKSWYRRRVVWPASGLIALVGLYWLVERVMSGPLMAA